MMNETEQKLAELRSRIAQLRTRIGQSTDVSPTQGIFLPPEKEEPVQNVDTTGSASRPSQADDLKAKLLGIKKQ